MVVLTFGCFFCVTGMTLLVQVPPAASAAVIMVAIVVDVAAAPALPSHTHLPVK